MILVIIDKDHSTKENAPVAPIATRDNDTTLLSALLPVR
jgi:hypothetical protein